jgi:hypothetical protein
MGRETVHDKLLTTEETLTDFNVDNSFDEQHGKTNLFKEFAR